ncbi:MAG TPA: ribbon-helix-helix protein, CopG family [Thermoanaerobaculia bacterium]|nr:ribbon-helix-helix protein, CopG family [Thermoanaerobaculia bacterium]
MPNVTAEITDELARRIDRIVRDGWFPSREALVREAIHQFVDAKSFLGDSPRMLQRFAADALNESKPETALRFVDRAMSLLATQDPPDLQLYQRLVELKVQILLVLGRNPDALEALEDARELLPNNPAINRWIDKVRRTGVVT